MIARDETKQAGQQQHQRGLGATMARDYRRERDALVMRFYGAPPSGRNPRPRRSSCEPDTINPKDGYAMPAPVNSPYHLYGHCIAWAYGLNQDGYGTLIVDGRTELIHRVSYRQTRGAIPEGKQVNHLCDRPYCFQPSHFYAGDQQDNADDRHQFNSNAMLSGWELARMRDWETDDPLIKRMRETQRIEYTEHWNPVERPVAQTMQDFTCPGHDFATTMSAGERKIHRICEEVEPGPDDLDEPPTGLLIARLWPLSQASDQIAEQFFQSGIMSPDLAQTVRSLADRASRISREENHPVSDCSCHHCSTDRKVIKEATLPYLDDHLKSAVRLCEAMRPHLQSVMAVADREAMTLAAQLYDLDDDQTQTLVEHVKQCQSDQNGSYDSAAMEEAIGAAAYCMANGMNPQQPGRQLWLFKAKHLYDNIRVTPDALQAAEFATHRARIVGHDVTANWTNKLHEFFPDLAATPDATTLLTGAALLIITTTLFERIRYQATGMCSHRQSWPAPHQRCAEEIAQSGHWSRQAAMTPFAEGKGYRANHDPLLADSAANVQVRTARSFVSR